MDPYYVDDSVQLFMGDCREIVPTLDVRPDCVVADPPYGETSLAWDRWPDGWPAVLATHWYRGEWSGVHHASPRVASTGRNRGRAVLKRGATPHTGQIRTSGWEDDGTRIQASVIRAWSMHGKALHPTEKPVGILQPLLEYACPPGGLVLDPFAGSGSTAVAARLSGRRAVLIEADERYCEVIARRLAQDVLPIGGV